MGNNNVYTALAFAAFLTLLAGVGFVWVKYNELTGSWSPF